MNSFDVIWSKHSYSGPSTLTLVQALLLWFKYQDDPVLKCAEEREVTSAEERGVTGAEERGVTDDHPLIAYVF